jgi:5'/3'-nucleotidase SurE
MLQKLVPKSLSKLESLSKLGPLSKATLFKITILTGLIVSLPVLVSATASVSVAAAASDTILDGGNAAGASCDKPALNILLTNDDGFDKPGIRALHRVFKQAGHRVVLAAPEKNASGSSTSVTFAAIKVTQAEPDVYAIAGSPATTVLLAASAFFPNNPPDLVISGINKGANLGPATPVSGTVGATIAAILIAQPAIPAIAVSTDPFVVNTNVVDTHVVDTKTQTSDEVGKKAGKKADLEHLNRVAEFVLALVGNLQTQHCDGSALLSPKLLPPKIALNVNYPPIPQEDIKGVQLHNQGKAPLFSLSYAPSEKDATIYVPRFAILPPVLNSKDGDTAAFHDGYITIVAIDGDYTASPASKAKIAPALSNLTP